MYVGQVKSNATPYVNVRNAPGGTKVGRLYPDTAVVLEYIDADGWGKLIDPVVSNNADRQWVMAAFLDLSQETTPEEPPVEPPPDEPGIDVTTDVHLSFRYDEQGALVSIHVLEQFSDGSSLAREFYPGQEDSPQ